MIDPVLVEEIRASARTLVRELGFMGGSFAGTELSPSAVHALIEIEKGKLTAGDLGSRLRLEKSSVSRMLRRLIDAGEVKEQSGRADGRVKLLMLTARGRKRVAGIHAFARRQVRDAMDRLDPAQGRTVQEGLRLYASALGMGAETNPAAAPLTLHRGYTPGLVARITHLHALYYAREYGFGQRFESRVAGGLAEFCSRLDHPANAIWTLRRGANIVGAVAIDGQDLGANVAHLRWFIVDDGMRGHGAGRTLLEAALAFADERGFPQTRLWTFSGLRAARSLYEKSGFALVEEYRGDQWGKEVLEQQFARSRPASP